MPTPTLEPQHRMWRKIRRGSEMPPTFRANDFYYPRHIIQYLFLVGSGLGLLVTLLSSLPLALSHFFVPSSSSLSNSGLGSFRCMKLQKPPLTQPSPLLSLQHASLKSVTGDSSQYMGRAAYQRLLRASQAVWAESSYLKRA